MEQIYDYIIIGAGSAGCVVANRLSADPSARVLLIEAGGSDRALRIAMPSAFTYAMDHKSFDWGFIAESEEHLNDRLLHHPRGKVLGGSSSINAMGFTRGHPEDFEGWAGNKMTDWSYAHCLPYFKRMETIKTVDSPYRGQTGPLNITQPKIRHVLNRTYIEACKQAGYETSTDTNGWQTEGFGPMDQTVYKGRRVSSSRAYLRPIEHRPNLTVKTELFVTRIIFKENRAVGIEYRHRNQKGVVKAACEIILSAGAINSPRLLMLSGIGNADELKPLGIKSIANLPGVGRNLQDHIDAQVKVTCRQPVSDTPCLLPHNKLRIGLQWLLFKTGHGATNHFEVGGYIRSRKGLKQPDVMLFFIPLLVKNDGSRLKELHGYQSTAVVCQPKSRGWIKLRSKDPLVPPEIKCNYLSDVRDLQTLKNGIQSMREIFSQSAFDEFKDCEIKPGSQDITDYIRETAKSTHHLSCTCPMGFGGDAVVDNQGRVHNIEGLRVVDASVMPTIPSAPLNATVIMLAEKLSDRIAGQTLLPPLYAEAQQTLTYSRKKQC